MKILYKTVLLTLLTTKAMAYPYLGLNYSSLKTSFNDKKDGNLTTSSSQYYATDYKAVSPSIGYEFADLFDNNKSVELSYFFGSSNNTNNDTGLTWTAGPLTGQPFKVKSQTSIRMINLDFMKAQRILPKELLDIKAFGILGLSLVDFKVTETYNETASISERENGHALSIGMGLETVLNEFISIVFKGKFYKVSGVDFDNLFAMKDIDRLHVFSVGMKIKF